MRFRMDGPQSCTDIWTLQFYSILLCRTVRLHEDWAWTALFKSRLKFSIGLSSGLWFSHSRTLLHCIIVFKPCVCRFFCMLRVIVLQENKSSPKSYIFFIFLQTESDYPPGIPYILLHSFLPFQAVQGLLPRSKHKAQWHHHSSSWWGWCVLVMGSAWCLPDTIWWEERLVLVSSD